MAAIAQPLVDVGHEVVLHAIEMHGASVNIYNPKNPQRKKIIKMFTELGTINNKVSKLQSKSGLNTKLELLIWLLDGISRWFVNPYEGVEKMANTLIMRFIYSLPHSGLPGCSTPLSKTCIENGVAGTEADLKRIVRMLKRPIAEVDALLQIDWRTDYVNESRIKYITDVSIGGQQLSHLLRLFQSVVRLDSQAPSHTDTVLTGGGGGRSRLNGYQLYVKSMMPSMRSVANQDRFKVIANSWNSLTNAQRAQWTRS